jgi:hypothetical protein
MQAVVVGGSYECGQKMGANTYCSVIYVCYLLVVASVASVNDFGRSVYAVYIALN